MRVNFTSLSIGVLYLLVGLMTRLDAQVNPHYVVLEDRAGRTELSLLQGQNTVEICGLEPGQTYGFMLVGQAAEMCLEQISLTNGGLSQVGMAGTMNFIALGSCVTLDISMLCPQQLKSLNTWLSVFCMSCKRSAEDAGLRYSVAQNGDADYLIREVFIGGGCFDVSGVSTIGSDQGLGEFNGGSPIGIERGVIMATGNVANSIGPNNSPSAGNSFGQAGDPDLTILAGLATYDATGIEFDFSPTIPLVSFRYVFASEEYPEYVCATFNDVFGFFVNGPGISGAFSNNSQNIAWIPGTNIPVGINSVNPGVPGSNGSPSGCSGKGSLNYSQYYVDNTGGQELQYDGWTTVFTAVANVEVCGNYHIKLVVADGGDGIYDSAVFLEANSFSAGGLADMEFQSPTTGSNLVYEACNDGIITICKSNPEDINIDATLNFTVDPSSTATAGVDYAPLPTSFFIPAGEMCIEYELEVYFDLINEGVETINLALELPCSCDNPFVTILISDTPPISAELDDFTVCQDEGVSLQVTVTGGVPGYEYLWNTGEVGGSINVYPNQTGPYTVTVTDECGQEVEAISNITVLPRPIATLEGDGVICAGDPNASFDVTVSFEPEDSGPWNISYMIDGEIYYINNITANPLIIPIKQPGFITLLDVFNSQCSGTVEGFGFIEESTVEVFYDITPVSCQGIEDGKILVIPTGIYTPYDFFWSGGWDWTDLLEPVGVGTYYVTITDALGCVRRDSVVISSPSDIEVSGLVTGGTECFSATGSVVLFVSGGAAPYSYLWSNGNTNQNPTDLGAGLNSVTVTDSRGCESYAEFNIVASDAPVAAAVPVDPATCGNPLGGSANLSVNGGTPPYSFNWSGNGGSSQNPTGLNGGPYQVTVTDNAGCTTVALVSVPFDTLAPLANAGAPDTLTCGVTSLQLDGSGSAQGAQYSYEWTTISGLITQGGTTLNPTIGLPGTYTIMVTNQLNGCTATSSVVVQPDLNAPQISLVKADTLTCAVTSIVLNGSGSSSGPEFTASWSTPNGVILSGATTLNPTVGAPGNYILTLTNTNNGCVSVQDIPVVADNGLPTVAIEPPLKVTCANPSIVLNGSGSQGGPQIAYSWSTQGGNIVSGGNSPNATINQPGTYTLLVTNTKTGCQDQRQVTVLEDKEKPLAVAGVSGLITCVDKEVELLGYGSTTGANIQYTWSTFGGSITGDPNALNTTANSASVYLLTVVNTENGCQDFNTIQVYVDTVAPIAFAGPPVELNCGKPQSILDGSNSSNAPFYAYQWTTPNGNILSGSTTLTPLVNQGGAYTLLVTDLLNGCTAESSTIVLGDFQIPQVIILDPAKLTCVVNQVTLDGSNSDFNSSVQFQWSTIGGNIVSGANTVTPVVNAPGQYSLLSLNTANGCQGFGTVLVEEDKTLPVANAGKPGEIYCFGDSVKLDGSLSSTGSAYTYDWYGQLGGPALYLNQQTPYTTEAGTYFLVVTDTRNGCTKADQVVIGADYLNAAEVKMTDPVCFDDPGTLEIYGVKGGLYPYQYSVDGGQNFQYNPRFRNLSSGSYKIVVRDAKGCEIKDDFEIPEVNEILVHVEPEILIRLGDEIRLEAQLNFETDALRSIVWYPAYGLDRTDSLVVFANPYITTPYFVTVIDTFGCEGKTQFKIVVRDPDIFIPNAFTPYNNDGNNDLLMIFAGDFGIEQVDLFEVFTRWGERVFRAENFQPNDERYGWNGLHQGKPLNPAVFVYYAHVRLIDGRIITLKGDVNLMN